MAEEYGIFKPLVENGGSLLAAAGALTLGFTKGARWQPPSEELPNGVSRLAALLCSVAIAILWKSGQKELGPAGLTHVAITAAALAVLGLLATTILNTNYSYTRVNGERILGGYALTDEAKTVRSRRATLDISPQRLFETGNDDPDLVWTRPSRSLVRAGSVLTYLMLMAAAPIALAAASLLVTFTN